MKTVAINRRARFDFELLETVEAGIMLTGSEAKSCRLGHIDLSGSYVSFLGGKPVLKHAKISPYRYADNHEYVPERDRPLLLHHKEAERLKAASEEKGLSVIPIEVKSGKFIKVTLAIGRGRKRFDKRAKIKERDVKRKLRQGRDV